MKRIKARKTHTNLILFATILQCNIAQIVYVKVIYVYKYLFCNDTTRTSLHYCIAVNLTFAMEKSL